MNRTETLTLVRLVKALCPGQKLDELTPDAWALVLDDVAFPDAQTAVRTIYRDRGNPEEFGARRIEADDVLREVRAIRRARLESTSEPAAPSGMTPAEYLEWTRQVRAAIADGRPVPEVDRGPLKERPELRQIQAGRPLS